MAQAAALGLTAAVSPVLIAKPAGAAVPKKGGHFIQAQTSGSTTDTLDRGTHTSSWNTNVEVQRRNCLTEIDDRFQPKPELAESRESSPDTQK